MIDNKELGRRAVACKSWRWMPGMMCNWGRVLAVHTNGYAHIWEQAVTIALMPKDAVPDLSDPATIGWMLHLVRKHWGDGGTHTKQVYRSGGYVEWICYAPSIRYPLVMSHGDSEAEALVKALEMEVGDDND